MCVGGCLEGEHGRHRDEVRPTGPLDACLEPWALGRLGESDPSFKTLRRWSSLGGPGLEEEAGEAGGRAGPLSTALVLVGGRGGAEPARPPVPIAAEQSVLPWRWPGLGPRTLVSQPLSCRSCCCSGPLPSRSWPVSWGTSPGAACGTVCLPKQTPQALGLSAWVLALWVLALHGVWGTSLSCGVRRSVLLWATGTCVAASGSGTPAFCERACGCAVIWVTVWAECLGRGFGCSGVLGCELCRGSRAGLWGAGGSVIKL